MPYGLIAELAAFGMTAWFVFVGEASTRAKLVVSAILLLTLVVPHLMPGWKAPIAAMIAQSLLVIGLGFYVTYTSARR
mgnify:FL=1